MWLRMMMKRALNLLSDLNQHSLMQKTTEQQLLNQTTWGFNLQISKLQQHHNGPSISPYRFLWNWDVSSSSITPLIWTLSLKASQLKVSSNLPSETNWEKRTSFRTYTITPVLVFFSKVVTISTVSVRNLMDVLLSTLLRPPQWSNKLVSFSSRFSKTTI